MIPSYNGLLIISFIVYGLILVFEFSRTGFRTSLIFQLILLIAVGLILHWTLGFPNPSNRIAFGSGVSPVLMIGIMYACVIIGIFAQSVYNAKGPWSWQGLAKPLCASPIVLFPLIGSVQQQSDIETMQLISFAILAFQNGFFWKLILEKVKSGQLKNET